jgi:hypothetical protein
MYLALLGDEHDLVGIRDARHADHPAVPLGRLDVDDTQSAPAGHAILVERVRLP